MEGELIVRGKVIGTKESKFENKTSRAVQVLKRNARNSMELINIKLADNMDPDKYPEQTSIEWTVDVNTFEKSVYFKAIRDIKGERSSAKAST